MKAPANIIRTTRVLGAFVASALLHGIALLGFEFYAAASGGDYALITTAVRFWWEREPGAFLITYLVVTAIVFYLMGHFHWFKKQERSE